MSSITVWFIRLAMIYLVLSMLLGLDMSVRGVNYPTMPIHAHLNLLGWMSMFIYGVAYHILPRFSGRALWSEGLATAHLWLANIGLVGMALGWVLRSNGGGFGVLLAFSLVEGLSIIFFVMNMLLTIKPAPKPPAKK